MFLTAEQLSNLNEESLRAFVELEIPEGYHLEYKSAPPGKSEKLKKLKFLRSVTGFANAAGGQLILGVAEPKTHDPEKSRILGLDKGQELAHRLERLAAASIEPRIPGLRIAIVPLQSGRQVIFVHVPPSLGKPHMVVLEGKREFFVRHSESTVPMSVHEIREAVFASAGAEARARNYLDRCEQDLKTYEVLDRYAFLMQAIPLISPDQPWPVLSDEMKEVLRGSSSTRFSTAYAPTPTLSGIKAFESRSGACRWTTEVHRNGYIAALHFDQPGPDQDQRKRIFLTKDHCTVFGSFCDLCKRATQVAGIDSPYVVRCRYIGADMAVLGVERRLGGLWSENEPYGRKEIVWPEMIRSAGEDFVNLAPEFCDLLYNTFGKEKSNWSQEST